MDIVQAQPAGPLELAERARDELREAEQTLESATLRYKKACEQWHRYAGEVRGWLNDNGPREETADVPNEYAVQKRLA